MNQELDTPSTSCPIWSNMTPESRLAETTDLRLWNGERVGACRRTRRLAPGVVMVCLVMIFSSFLFVIAPPGAIASGTVTTGPDCQRCPSGSGCEPNCGGGGCPEGTIVVTSSISAKPTEVWINWTTNMGSTSSMSWGNTTSYSYNPVSNSYGSSWSIFINYLSPGSTYYYTIVASLSCYTSGGSTGKFSTGSDSLTTISGTVYDAKTLATAPANTIVEVWCVHNPNSWYVWGYTNSNGYYSLNVAGGGLFSIRIRRRWGVRCLVRLCPGWLLDQPLE
jgi:hypothetical protein